MCSGRGVEEAVQHNEAKGADHAAAQRREKGDGDGLRGFRREAERLGESRVHADRLARELRDGAGDVLGRVRIGERGRGLGRGGVEGQRAGAIVLARAGDRQVLPAALGDPALRVVATRVGAPASLGIVVQADSPVRAVADLKGQTGVVSSARGSISQYQLY
ncbi:hypothetical protein ACU7M0_36655, partial [Burkholderia cenocepacia]